MIAASGGHYEVISTLTEFNADVNAGDLVRATKWRKYTSFLPEYFQLAYVPSTGYSLIHMIDFASLPDCLPTRD